MGYRIRYGDAVQKTKIRSYTTANKARTSVIIIVCISLLFVFLYGKSDELRYFLLPGNAAVTEAALDSFAEDIRKGGSLGDAITAFCREIINNANLPS